jgi:peptidoglycan/xylan/chitin deacetylase (PgdA/CDA1 family)
VCIYRRSVKKLLLTFDYELFLGPSSGSVERCLIIPTNRILDILGRSKVKGVFFIDTIYLLRLKAIISHYPEAGKDYNAICGQIKKIYLEGHSVFLHIHPHWLDAIYLPDINEWNLSDTSRYRFSSLNEDERESSIKTSIDILKEILEIDEITGFRAGGWSIQPFEIFRPHLQKFGVRYDFSVLPGEYFYSNVQSYDYSDVDEEIYHFDDIEKPCENGFFKEYSNSTFRLSKISSFISRVENFITSRLSFGKRYGNGKGISNNSPSKSTDFRLVSIENLNLSILLFFIFNLRKREYVQFTSHPKLISPLHIFYFRIFLLFCFNSSKVATDFRKIMNE